MPDLNIDVELIFGLWLAGALVMIPLLTLAVRVGVVPLLDCFARIRQASSADRWIEMSERLLRLEERLSEISELLAEARPTHRSERTAGSSAA